MSVNENKNKTNKILNDILTQTPSQNLSENDLDDSMSVPLKEARERFEKKYILNQIRINHGNISKTADNIGMERSALHRKLKILGIKGIN
jgi:two-component system nitrogen regulation response regulator NtrX